MKMVMSLPRTSPLVFPSGTAGKPDKKLLRALKNNSETRFA